MCPSSELKVRWVRGSALGLVLGTLVALLALPPSVQRFNCRQLAEPAFANAVANAYWQANHTTASLEEEGIVEWSRYHPVVTAVGGLGAVGAVGVAWLLVGWVERRARSWWTRRSG